MGDIVIGHNPANNAWVYGIVGDSGNDDIKEASIAFNHALSGGTATPVASSYQQVVSAFHIREPKLESKRISFLLLPHTRVKFDSKYTQSDVRRLAEEAFLRWGGSFDNPAQALLRAKQRFTACKATLSRGE